MKIKRLLEFASASVLSLSTLMTLGIPLAHAAALTCTWTGATDLKFSTATNWSGCSSAAPVSGDNLIFDNTSLSSTVTLNNDILALSVGTVDFSGTNTNHYAFILHGSAITLNGTVTNSGTNFSGFGINVTLGTNITLNGGINFDSSTGSTQTLNMNGHNLTTATSSNSNFNIITGTGNINMNGDAYLNGANPSWTGTLNLSSTGSAAVYTGTLTANTAVVVASGGSLSLCKLNGATVASPLTIGGSGSGYGAVSANAACGSGGGSAFDATGSVNWTGPITLTSNTTIAGLGDFKVSGSLSGAFTVTEVSGGSGTVTINATSNQSQTGNGSQTSAPLTTDYKDNSPTTSINVSANNIANVDGTYGDTYVDSGGILKGTGTVGKLRISTGGIVAPGHSPGCLASGNLTLAGTYQVDIGGTDPCTGYDQLVVTGTVNLTGSTLDATLYGGFVPKVGQSYTIINNDAADAVTGTFTGIAEGGTYSNQGVTYTVTYQGGDGNDVVLTVKAVDATAVIKKPDTGFALVSAHPLLALATSTLAAAAILVVARKLRPSTK